MRLALVAPLVTVIAEPQRGGSQAFVADLARGLAMRGHDVHVYAASGSEIPGARVIDTGVDHAPLADTLYRAGDVAGAGGPAHDAAASAAAESAFARVYAGVREVGYDILHNHAFDAPAVSLGSISPPPWCTPFTFPLTPPSRGRSRQPPGVTHGP